MSHLIVFAFPTRDGAYAARDALDALHRQGALSLSDAAVVVRTDDGKVRIQQATNLVGMGALGGSVWGALVGMFFLSPWLGLAVGAVAGALAGRFTDIGIDDDFIRRVGQTVGPDQSALFLLIDSWDEAAVTGPAMALGATVLYNSLPDNVAGRRPPAADGHAGGDAA